VTLHDTTNLLDHPQTSDSTHNEPFPSGYMFLNHTAETSLIKALSQV